MQINNGQILPTQDQHGNPLFTARTNHEIPDPVQIFYTSSAAVFWLWLIDERVRGAAARFTLNQE